MRPLKNTLNLFGQQATYEAAVKIKYAPTTWYANKSQILSIGTGNISILISHLCCRWRNCKIDCQRATKHPIFRNSTNTPLISRNPQSFQRRIVVAFLESTLRIPPRCILMLRSRRIYWSSDYFTGMQTRGSRRNQQRSASSYIDAFQVAYNCVNTYSIYAKTKIYPLSPLCKLVQTNSFNLLRTKSAQFLRSHLQSCSN